MASPPNPSDYDDPQKLRNLLVNARRLGRDDLAFQCQVRLAELAGREYDDIIEREFWIALTAAEEFRSEERGRTSRFSRTRQKYDRVGSMKVIEDLAANPSTKQGFEVLVKNGRADLTFEAIVMRHPQDFSEAARDTARSKLLNHGVSKSQIEGWMNGQG